MAFIKGFTPWNKGTPCSLETKRKISLALIGRSSPNKGKKMAQEQRIKLSIARKGIPNSMKGKKHTKKSRENMRLAHIGKQLTLEHRMKISISLKGKNINRIFKNCLNCGKVFYTIPSRIKYNKGKFCSRSCGKINRFMSLKTREKISMMLKKLNLGRYTTGKYGSQARNWKGGVTLPNKIERGKFRRDIQRKVLERDNYTCQICNERGCSLTVDHIQSWRDYVELRFDINNCRTLCQKCHYKITFGKEMPESVKSWGRNFKYIERGILS